MGKGGRYLFVFILTCGIFAISWYVSGYFNQKRLAEVRSIQDQIATSIIASETDFSLLQEQSCADLNQSITSEELNKLASKISFSEQSTNDLEEISVLKSQYSVLQVKDFLLKKRISERCKTPFYNILYFYDTKANCESCTRQGYVLDAIRQKYPALHIYSFDHSLDLSTIRALKRIYKIGETLPSIVINGKAVSGFKTIEEVEALLPKTLVKPVEKPKASTSTTKPQTATTSETR